MVGKENSFTWSVGIFYITTLLTLLTHRVYQKLRNKHGSSFSNNSGGFQNTHTSHLKDEGINHKISPANGLGKKPRSKIKVLFSITHSAQCSLGFDDRFKYSLVQSPLY